MLTDRQFPDFLVGRFDAVAIGSSTGGPRLVEGLLSGLPADLPLPIFVAQHLPPNFTESFAIHLDNASPLNVVHAEHGMPVLPGTVYIGRGHQHMRIRRGAKGQVTIEISPEPTTLLFRPSADELFRTCAEVYSSHLLAVVMTGIGRDGTAGASIVREKHGVVVSQDEASCAVYGMPRSCAEAGLSNAILTPEGIRRCILQLSPNHRKLAFAS